MILRFGVSPETWRRITLDSIKWSNLIMEEMDMETTNAGGRS